MHLFGGFIDFWCVLSFRDKNPLRSITIVLVNLGQAPPAVILEMLLVGSVDWDQSDVRDYPALY